MTGDQAVGTRDKTILWEAEFNPKVRTYWLLSGALVLLATVVGIPLLPFWFLFGYGLDMENGCGFRRLPQILAAPPAIVECQSPRRVISKS